MPEQEPAVGPWKGCAERQDTPADWHPYDAHDSGQLSLRQNAEEITSEPRAEIVSRGKADVPSPSRNV